MSRFVLLLVAPLVALLSLAGLAPAPTTTPALEPATRPLLIAHRGASGHRPEHTLEAYRLGIAMGADFIEPDLVLTRDGHLVARHEPLLAEVNDKGQLVEATTDVADRPEFADRRSTRLLDGVTKTGWWADDFTLAELRTLRARERLPKLRPASATHDGKYPLATLEEVVALAQSESKRLGRTIGVYPETKHPTYSRAAAQRLGVPPMEDTLLRVLHTAYGNDAAAPVFIQSFETTNLRELRPRTRLRLVQLVLDTGRPFDLESAGDPRAYADLLTPEGLRFVRTYADGIGPHKSLVIPRTPDGRLAAPTSLVRDAHAAGLAVHPWTFRAENPFLPPALRSNTSTAHGDLRAELRAYLATGIDGLFSDHPDVAAEVLGRN